MKKLLYIYPKFLFFLLAMAAMVMVTSCDDVQPTLEVCGETVTIEKRELSNGLFLGRKVYNYYLNSGDIDRNDLQITAFFAKKSWASADVTDVTLIIDNAEIKESGFFLQYKPDTDEHLIGLFHSYFGSTAHTGGYIAWTDYNEAPTFTITFSGDCPEETTTLTDNDIETVDGYVASSLIVNPEIAAGSSIDITLLSNNEEDEEQEVAVTSDLGETEVIQFTDGKATLTTVLSNTKGTDNDGKINGEEGTVLTFTYADNLAEDGSISPISVEITLTGENAPLCDDGIMNGDETDVDCGGSCDACPTCDDGIMNGDETEVDCGGSSCEACAVLGCTDSDSHNYNADATEDDGSCETCDDGIKNGDETAIDCGGSLCEACSTTSFSDFLDVEMVLVKSAVEDSNGSEKSSFVPNEGYPCFDNYYEIYKSDSSIENYVNDDDGDCSEGSIIQFTQKWVLDGNTLTISETDGTSPKDWILEVTSSTTFNLSTPHPNGIDTQVWYYETAP